MGPSGTPAGPTLYDQIMADSPLIYLRLGEASGTTAVNAAGGTNGAYYGMVSLGNPALYTGGPTSFSPADGAGRAYFPGTAMPGGISEITLGVVFRPTALTGLRYLVTRDRSTVVGTGNRFWQWRINGPNFDFIKITGGTQQISAAHGLVAGVPAIVHARVTSAGAVTMFVNGSSVGGGNVTASISYGAPDNAEVAVGNLGASNSATVGDRYSEAFVIPTAISDARSLAHAPAGGFA
jgi:hypothetical protein